MTAFTAWSSCNGYLIVPYSCAFGFFSKLTVTVKVFDDNRRVVYAEEFTTEGTQGVQS